MLHWYRLFFLPHEDTWVKTFSLKDVTRVRISLSLKTHLHFWLRVLGRENLFNISDCSFCRALQPLLFNCHTFLIQWGCPACYKLHSNQLFLLLLLGFHPRWKARKQRSASTCARSKLDRRKQTANNPCFTAFGICLASCLWGHQHR